MPAAVPSLPQDCDTGDGNAVAGNAIATTRRPRVHSSFKGMPRFILIDDAEKYRT
jgi:hypothetical protein